MTGLAILSRDHVGRWGSRAADRGAVSGGLVESVLVARYLLAAEEALVAAGWKVLQLSDHPGTGYSARHQRANEHAALYRSAGGVGPMVYVAGHVNAGGGRYGVVGFDHRSRQGPRLASEVALRLSEVIDGEARVSPTSPDAPEPWTRAMHAVIAGVGAPVALCFEPAFIDHPDHAALLSSPDGCERIGRALAAGVLAWAALPTTTTPTR